MSDDFEGVAEVKSDCEPNSWVDLHVTCTELWPTSAEKMRQSGRLTDAEGDSIKFISWKEADAPHLDEGASYVIEDAQVITDPDEDRSIIFRKDTEVRDADSPGDGDSPNGPDCKFCGESMPADAYNEGPGAPEIGWEYYHCPHCNEKMRADTVR